MTRAVDAPDILVICTEWPARALLSAQLIEEGHNVVPAESWPPPRVYFRAPMKPRAVVVDLHRLPDPHLVIDELPALAPPSSIVVIGALASVPVEDLRRRGFEVVARPAPVSDVAAAVTRVLARSTNL